MAVSPDNFSACIAHCKSVKVQYGRLFGLVPQQFSIRRDGSEIFFLAPEPMIGNSLYAVTVADEDQGQHPWEKVRSHDTLCTICIAFLGFISICTTSVNSL